jgi:hypothetical protein
MRWPYHFGEILGQGDAGGCWRKEIKRKQMGVRNVGM